MQARSMMTTLMLTGEPLTIDDVVTVARAGRRVALSPQAIAQIERAHAMVESAWEPEMRLTPFLTPQPGVQSGLMIVQYTAAALVAEIRALAQPASIASLPTSGGIEDWNSHNRDCVMLNRSEASPIFNERSFVAAQHDTQAMVIDAQSAQSVPKIR